MCKQAVKINNSLCFCCRVHDVATSHNALTQYNELLKEGSNWLKETSDMPIFFDTNVLLNIYDISSDERESFIKFVEKNSKRIYICSQVRREYLRHRVLQIRGVSSRMTQLKKEILTSIEDLDKLIENKLEGIKGVAYRSIVKYGMPTVHSYLSKIIDNLSDNGLNQLMINSSNISKDISIKIDEDINKINEIAAYEYKDPLLEALTKVNYLTSLEEEEKNFVIEKYKELRATYDNAKDGWSKECLTFPGSGDVSKPIDVSISESIAWGDLYIYCEMLKFMKEKETHVLFITRDVSKGDWLKKSNNQPFVHYIENAYEMTQHIMMIKNSDSYLPLVTEENPSEVKHSDSIAETIEVIVEDEEATQPSIVTNDTNAEDEVTLEEQTPVEAKRKSKYKDITQDEFVAELMICEDWANSYGAGYVNENYFLYDILGQKLFYYEKSRIMLEKLIKENVVEKWQTEIDDKTIPCIRLKHQEAKNHK